MAVKILLPALIAVAILAPAADAEPTSDNSGQNPVVRPVFDQPANVSGKSLVGVTVSYPPGAKSGAHHHAKSAFIMAYVISGAIRSQVEGEPARVYHAGETWLNPLARTTRSVKMPAPPNPLIYSQSSCSIPETAC